MGSKKRSSKVRQSSVERSRHSLSSSNRGASQGAAETSAISGTYDKNQSQYQSLINMQQLVPYHVQKEINLNDTWTIGPLNKFSYDEKKILHREMKEQLQGYHKIAQERYSDHKNTSLMISENDHKIRNEVMRRNTIQQLKHKHMHDFRRKVVNEILEERKKQPGYSPDAHKARIQAELETSSKPQSTADVSPNISRMTLQEQEVRNSFNNYITDIVSKNGGEGGGKKDKSREATEFRAMQAIEGANKYLKNSSSITYAEHKRALTKLAIESNM